MQLGSFSVSLAVEDLGVSRRFYEKLGFASTGGDPDQGWLIMRSGDTTIGLFAGMFDTNVLTFNPGLGQDMQPLDDPDDIRDIHEQLVLAGLEPTYGAPGTDAPDNPMAGEVGEAAHFMLKDPDGNVILIDQFDRAVIQHIASQ